MLIFDSINGEYRLSTSFKTEDTGNPDISWLGANSDILACASDDGAIHMWSIHAKGAPHIVQSLLEHDDTVSALETHPSEKDTLLSSSWDGLIKLWNTRGTSNSAKTFQGHADRVFSVSWNPISQGIFASGSQDRSLRIWDRRNTAPSSTYYPLHSETRFPVTSVLWGSEHTLVLAGNTGVISLVDMRSFESPVWTRKVHRAAVHCLTFSPDSKVIASGSDDKTVSLLDPADGKALQTFSHHSDFVRSVGWSKDDLLASASWDRSVVFASL